MNVRSRHGSSLWHDLTARLISRVQETGAASCFLVTSWDRREGRTSVCRAVAAQAHEMGRKVGIVEIQSPERVGFPSLAGLQSPAAYTPDRHLGFALWTLPESFSSFPAFSPAPRGWVTGCDIILIDAPLTGSFIQQHLAPLTDGVILVVDTRKRRMEHVVQVVKSVTAGGGRFVGAVLNRHCSPLPRWLDRWDDRP